MPLLKIWQQCCGVIVIFFIFTMSHAGEFSDWKKQQQSGYLQSKDDFELYRAEIDAAFKEYQQKTAAVWGKDNVAPDGKNWVSYIDSLEQRSVVDFEQGVINVEVTLPAGTSANDVEGREKLERAVLKALRQGEDKRPIQHVAAQPVSQPEGKDVMVGQISRADGSVAKKDDYKTLAHEAAENAGSKTLRGDDGKMRVVYQAQLKLVPNHIRVRAIKFQALVNKYSAKYQLPPELVFAVMEAESMFNPTARSGAPAFGLMQLVPNSGARDAYRYIYKEDRVVSDTYLYNPENNVRLGAAYLRRLNNDYLGGIKSDKSRLLASIAAYNTGAGNVFRTFIGSSYSRSQYKKYSDYRKAALTQINRRSPEQVYQYLRSHLPYEETRHYIRKVTENMGKYSTI